jgi:predicted acyltransferase
MTKDRHHLVSLDVVRGMTVAAMILVNNPGDWNSVFPPLLHADWNGWTFADIVFPFFVFIMGCAMPFAFARRQAQHGAEWRAAKRILRRASLLVLLGLLLNLELAFPNVAALRIPGVLQRLGLAYLGAALLVRSTSALTQAAAAVALMVGHWAVMTLVPFGGLPASHIVTRDHNLAGFVDAHVFGSHTLMRGFDPEGLLGTAPTIATALLGALAGQWLRRHSDHRRQLAGLMMGAFVATVLGLIWSTVWPINKPLWTGSYALLMSGFAAATLAVCLFIVDIAGIRGWARPFLALGVNPLAIYFGSEFIGHLLDRHKYWIYWGAFARIAGGLGGEWASLLYALAYVGCWLAIAVVLDRRHIRIRV